ncbi:uncharacterized protein [Euphorbia lathyris]|uniref:uncharacterized protein n=1 Tax=Euphorbia lathyris TaxID=212925 RepID=UPI003313F59F
MEAAVTLSFPSFNKTFLVSKPEVVNKLDRKAWTSVDVKRQKQHTKTSVVGSALPETAASLAIAATVVGAAATLLARRTKASETNEIQLKECEDCGGSGICSECKGEGFVLKRLTEQNAEKARLNAKNMATRYTAALPKKWSYCTKCSSARSCNTCGGSGKLSY